MIYGIVDVGSNTIRLSIYKYEDNKVILLLNKKTMAGLASYVKNGELSKAGIKKACEVLKSYREIVDNFQIENVFVFATASLRNVSNTDEAILRIKEETGFNTDEIDGMTGFVFKNRYGGVPNYNTVNQAIKRIINSHNADEIILAKREKREPVIIPNFSCHHFRHTFATRLCEVESNLKVIQSIMGHRNIETTMDVYAEATDRKKKESMDNLSAKLDIF